MTTQKPPPITIGVNGFNAFVAEPTPQPDPSKAIDWAYLFTLPPFEMYLSEQTGNMNKDAWQAWLATQLGKLGDEAVYQVYADWHAAKGYWAGETPMGELIKGTYHV